MSGGGTVTLSNADRVRGSGILTNVDNTIQGETSNSGSLGTNEIGIINQASGSILANVSGLVLNVDPDGTDGLINHGTMNASNGGILQLNGSGSGAFTNTGATISALAGSELRLTNGVSITGGTLSAVGTGFIHSLNTATLNSLTLSGSFIADNNSTTTLVGTLTNTGSITINSTGSFTDLTISGNLTLSGGGTVTLSNADRVRGSGILTNVDNTIQGETSNSGSLGTNEIGIINQASGSILANVSGLVLNVDPDGTDGLINHGTMNASNGGILQLNGSGSGAFTNTGATISALAGSELRLTNGVSITGGTLSAVGTGFIHSLNTATLNSLTLSGSFIADNNSTTTLVGTLTNTGSITINSTGSFTDLTISGNLTLSGGGTVTLSNADRVRGSGILTNVDNTIQGETSNSGSLGTNEIGIINQAGGSILANVSGKALSVDPNSDGLVNQGTMDAINGGILLLSGNGGGTFTNAGTIKSSGGALQVTGAVTSSGTVDVGSDTLSITGSGSYTQTRRHLPPRRRQRDLIHRPHI